METTHTAPAIYHRPVIDALSMLAAGYLLVVGVWSGPSYGASLAYPTGVLWVEAVEALLLISRWPAARRFPFLQAGLGVIALAALAAWLRPGPFDLPAVWRHAEPFLRGVLIFLAVAGDPRRQRAAWVCLLAGVSLLALAAVVQHVQGVIRWYPVLAEGWAGGWHPVPGPRAQGLTSYINLTAAILAAALPLWVFSAAFAPPADYRTRLTLLIGALLTGAALWYTAARGPLLAVLLVSVLAWWRLAPARGWQVPAWLGGFLLVIIPAKPPLALAGFVAGLGLLRWRLAAAVALGLAVGGGLLCLDAYVLHRPISWRISQEGLGDTARLALFADAARVVGEAPLWGIGDRAFADRFPDMRHPALRALDLPRRNAHNQYLQWAAAEGLPVALAATALLLWTAGWTWRNARRRGDILSLAAGAGLVVFLLANLVDAHCWRIEGAGFYWMVVALAAARLTRV